MTNQTWWMPSLVGLAWVLGLSVFAGLVALSHKLKKQLRRERLGHSARYAAYDAR